QKLFPDDPGFKVQLALLRTLNDDRAGAQTLLHSTRAQFGNDQTEAIGMLFDIVNMLAHLDDAMTDPSRLDLDINRAVLKANQASGIIGGGRGSSSAMFGTRALTLPPVVESGIGRLFQLMLEVERVKDDDVAEMDRLLAEIGRSVDVHPDGLMLYFRG